MSFASLEPVDRRATASIIADTVRDRIMDGTFAPDMQLTETQLAEALGVSRGPVREAFQRLVQEGLLRAEPHRGVFVTRLDADAATDVLLARRAVETTAAAEVAARGDAEVLGRLRALVEEMEAAASQGWAAVADVDLRFHEALVAGAGSPRLIRMYATLLVETRLCLRSLPFHHPEPQAVVAEHNTLLAALEVGDAATAAATVQAHLEPRPGEPAPT